MYIFLTIATFILGTIIGSFLNVVLYRYNTGRGIGGRSHCFSCRRKLTAIDLVPVFSYIFLRGRCRHCKSKISPQYLAVELLTGVLFAGAFVIDSSLFSVGSPMFLYELVYHFIVMSFLVLIIVYDMKHKIIPDAFAYGFAFVAVLHLFIGINPAGNIQFLHPGGWEMLAGAMLAFPFYFLWLVSGGRWMGLGDAKLALGIGWFLGLSAGISAIVLSFWVGAAVSILLLAAIKLLKGLRKELSIGLRSKLPHLTIKSEVPFAPFLIIGLLSVFFFGYNMFSNLTFF
jgi:prepilin signal peptidase PulO-like enzyme (type II secretory pathway)